ncbi:hypothetical protein AK812_SmicGene25920 [Symbiodinium microadriaticum]|uniref:Uncharacterized protein n=1 Tax=Symbiodinium microadriaticum TaxID=2951 RepID=A0A1Q9DAX4_SYMMI|nr:hypothetical protein AK812_SmicGene25920 [Symbiodinium microadriaticum]
MSKTARLNIAVLAVCDVLAFLQHLPDPTVSDALKASASLYQDVDLTKMCSTAATGQPDRASGYRAAGTRHCLNWVIMHMFSNPVAGRGSFLVGRLADAGIIMLVVPEGPAEIQTRLTFCAAVDQVQKEAEEEEEVEVEEEEARQMPHSTPNAPDPQARKRSLKRSFSIPLGGAVRVTSTKERELVNFFSQVGELTMVPFGRLYRPEGIRVGYVPAVALRTPHTKVVEEIEDGCPITLADGECERLVHLLEITPTKRMQDLRPGEAQLVAILLAVFRDPDVLVLNRPCALLTDSQHRKVWTILDLWQMGGAAMVLGSLGFAADLPSRSGAPRRKRTVITSQQDVALDPNWSCSVYDLDLDTGKGVFVPRSQTRTSF